MRLIASALNDKNRLSFSRGQALVELHGCEGAKFHSPMPLLTSPIVLGDLVRKVAEEDTLTFEPAGAKTWLCGNCQANLEVFIRLMLAYNGEPPWAAKREFGNTTRELGMQAWAYREEATRG